jgi:predicted TIM-barrel fold metal-dependent hydrolase
LPDDYSGLIKYVEVDGRTKIALRNRISDYIPNPTFEVVAAPGAQEEEFRQKNPHSNPHRSSARPPITPEYDAESGRVKPIRSVPAFFAPEPRLQLMDELGIDRAVMWPTLASLLEERLADDPVATHAVVHAFNQWMHDEWTFDYKDRIFATPIVTLPIVEKAIAELDWVVERGARAILVRPAPAPDFNERRRSFALPEFDPFWRRVEEAGVLVGMHSSGSYFQRYLNDWEGMVDQEFLPFKRGDRFAFSAILNYDHRYIHDTVASIIGHELSLRFPKLRFVLAENGASWVRALLDKLARMYERTPELFPEDPVAVFKRCIFVQPFHEEDPVELVEFVGADNVLFGSDYPHPEGMADPLAFADLLDGLPGDDVAKVMGGNLARLMHTPVLGYWNRPDETEWSLRDGLLHTGDIGRLEEDGS